MKRSLLFLSLFFTSIFSVFAQQENWRLKLLDDKWYRQYAPKALRVGDTMPDIPLGKVLNNKTGASKFADLKGKLVILDFWNTGCSVCIANFPKMEALQKEFGDKIQIFLANTEETEEDIRRVQSERERRNAKKIVFPDLPSIVFSKSWLLSGITDTERAREFVYENGALNQLFPTRGVPHHVWIDGNGVVRIIGNSENTYASKINDLLKGELIDSKMNDIEPIAYMQPNQKVSFNQLLGYFRTPQLKMGSFITPYNKELNTWGFIQESSDTITQTQRATYVNIELLNLYIDGVYKDGFYKREVSEGLLYAPGYRWMSMVEFPKLNGTILSLYSSNYIKQRLWTDVEYVQSRWCYEQVVPQNVSEEQRKQLMLDELNRYFGSVYGLSGGLEKRMTRILNIVRMPNSAAVSVNKPAAGKDKALLVSMPELIEQNPSLKKLLEINSETGKGPFLFYNKTGGGSRPRVDYNLIKEVKQEFPVNQLQTIADLKRYLQTFGLDLEEEEKEIKKLVFKKVEGFSLVKTK